MYPRRVHHDTKKYITKITTKLKKLKNIFAKSKIAGKDWHNKHKKRTIKKIFYKQKQTQTSKKNKIHNINYTFNQICKPYFFLYNEYIVEN